MMESYGVWDYGVVDEEILLDRILKQLHICKARITRRRYVRNEDAVNAEYEGRGFSSLLIYYKGRTVK